MINEQKKRKALSKKTRFDVFKRDGFKCQYCGAHPPSVLLHVDHINPVADGGTNAVDNLVTACEPCNLGKGVRLLSDVPKSLSDKAKEVAEKELQIQGFNEVLSAKAERLDNEAWDIAAVLQRVERCQSFNRLNLLSIKRFLEILPKQSVIDAAEIAAAQRLSDQRAFKYFCAVCWNKSRAGE
jgi:HNH endonuclease